MKIVISEITKTTRKPTLKRIYRSRYEFKIKFYSERCRVGDIFYDCVNKLQFYVVYSNENNIEAISINKSLKSKLKIYIYFIFIGTSFSEKSIITVDSPSLPNILIK